MNLSIITDVNLQYPKNDHRFSPYIKHPEYPFSVLSNEPNVIYDAVRETFHQAGLDAANFGTASWNPLGKYIRKGDRVFLLCNFVYHRRPGEQEKDFLAKCTHGSVIRALIDYVLIATGVEGIVSFGNAPLQSCDFKQVLSDTGAGCLPDFYRSQNICVKALDLRMVAKRQSILGNTIDVVKRDESDVCHISLDEDSMLDELYKSVREVPLRVTDYNPDRIQQFHQYHKHAYIVHRDILESDVILSVPKLKTHEKVGLTVGLKGLVGIIGHKDCLAHHRFGPPSLNGDEYPDDGRFQVWASRFHDFVQRENFPAMFRVSLQVIDKNLRRFIRLILKNIVAGAWYGNDTAWRMTLDLARIVTEADKSGKMTKNVRRTNLVMVDGVVAGEGNGPLSPSAVNAGCLIFSDDLSNGDLAACRLMGWNKDLIPLLQNSNAVPAFQGSKESEDISCILNGKSTKLSQVPPAMGRKFIPAEGWKSKLLSR